MKFETTKNNKKYFLKPGLIYHSHYIPRNLKENFIEYFQSIHPIFEQRFSKHNPPPLTDHHRELLRPVYWLGNWQFACLDYYHPPHGIDFRALKAENYPTFMARVVREMETIVRSVAPKKDIPKEWELNTCLINFYGDKFIDGQWVDCARVGDHKDFEPGPVASLSFGERAFFQFVRGQAEHKNNVCYEQWLDDSSLLIFYGDFYKNKTFHRVQRVEKKIPSNNIFQISIERFHTRRINLTFRYVPKKHIYQLEEFPREKTEDIMPYIHELKFHSPYYGHLYQTYEHKKN